MKIGGQKERTERQGDIDMGGQKYRRTERQVNMDIGGLKDRETGGHRDRGTWR